MSDLLNSASLVMIPSGYKEDVVYSQIPTDGSGDLSFTRASNGTRINSAGLVEVCPWNLLEYSEDFSSVYWGKDGGVTVSTNTTTAPNGTTTADTILYDGTANQSIYKTSISGLVGAYTLSFYIKAPSGEENKTINFRMFQNINQNITLTNEWVRYEFTTTAGSNNDFEWGIKSSATARSIYLWGAQLNIGSTAKPYFPTTDRLNVPRLTYQNGGGGCPSLLLEKQSTNLLTYSEQFDNAAWVKSSGSVTANQATSPDGTQNADLIAGEVYQQKTQANATTYTMSVFAKKQSATTVYIGYIDNVTGFAGGSIVYTYSTGAITVNQSANSSVSGKAIDMGNGWIRLSITYTTIALVTFNYQYIGSTGSYIYGAQLEASSYATSYIPTTSSSATRVADACFKTGISSLIGQTEGTVFVELDYSNTSGLNMFLSIRPDASNKVEVYRDGAVIYGEITASSSFAISATKSMGTHKIAFAYKSGSSALYIDGVLISENTTSFSFNTTLASISISSRIDGTYSEAANYKEVILFKTRLTNAELASLTTI